MPTGYTAGIADGTITDFKAFALQLARGMGALVSMRDEPWDAPIPERFEPSDYNLKRLEEAQREAEELEAMSLDELQDACDKWNAENEQRKIEAVKKNTEQRNRYLDFIKQAEVWEGAPEGIQKFALEQLRSSLEFDTLEDPLKYYEPSRTVGAWYAAKRKDIDRRLKYHAEEYAKEVARVEERNVWLTQLRKSLEKY